MFSGNFFCQAWSCACSFWLLRSLNCYFYLAWDSVYSLHIMSTGNIYFLRTSHGGIQPCERSRIEGITARLLHMCTWISSWDKEMGIYNRLCFICLIVIFLAYASRWSRLCGDPSTVSFSGIHFWRGTTKKGKLVYSQSAFCIYKHFTLFFCTIEEECCCTWAAMHNHLHYQWWVCRRWWNLPSSVEHCRQKCHAQPTHSLCHHCQQWL